MANDGTGNSWDENDPLGNLPARDGQVQIRDLRKGTRQRAAKEHTTFADGGAGGEHLPGSAVVYYAAAASTPTKRPDTTTNLDASDKGRLWFVSDTLELKVWTGAAFSSIKVSTVLDGAITTAKIADGAVTAPKIPDGTITTAKIASGAVTGGQIQDGAVSASKIADANVTPAKIQPNSIGSGQLDGTTLGLLAVRVKKGNFAGNGTTTRAVTGLGFMPNVVLIVDSNTGVLSIATDSIGANVDVVGVGWMGANTFSFDADGFTVKTTNANINTNGRTYAYIALRVNS